MHVTNIIDRQKYGRFQIISISFWRMKTISDITKPKILHSFPG